MTPEQLLELNNIVFESEMECIHDCKTPICACTGAYPAEIVFLPGEAGWIKQQVGHIVFYAPGWVESFRIGPNTPCFFKAPDNNCKLGRWRPFVCHLFPLEVEFTEESFLIGVSSHCSMVGKLQAQFALDRVHALELIKQQTSWEWQQQYNNAATFCKILVKGGETCDTKGHIVI